MCFGLVVVKEVLLDSRVAMSKIPTISEFEPSHQMKKGRVTSQHHHGAPSQIFCCWSTVDSKNTDLFTTPRRPGKGDKTEGKQRREVSECHTQHRKKRRRNGFFRVRIYMQKYRD